MTKLLVKELGPTDNSL